MKYWMHIWMLGLQFESTITKDEWITECTYECAKQSNAVNCKQGM